MRISTYNLSSIKRRILDDMYSKTEQNLETRKTLIAQQNRDYYLEPLDHILAELPDEMLPQHKEYTVRIKYKQNTKDTEFALNELWTYRSEIPILNPHEQYSATKYSYQHAPAESSLDPKLYAITAILCNEILALQVERDELSDFLHKTTQKYSGTLQLRKIWPESLHKYLPAEPAKTPRKNKILKGNPIELLDPVVPTFIPTRLTTNLLEGS